MKKNDIIELEITGLTQEGNGVGHYDGMAVFVPCTAVGDRIEVQIVKILSRYMYGICKRVITPSPDRIAVDCDSDRLCGGCAFRHIGYDAELRAKQSFVTDAFRRIGGITVEPEPILACSSPDFYRNKAQYPVGNDGKLFCGFYSRRSHRLVPCGECRLQPRLFSEINSFVTEYADKCGIEAYDEKSGRGLLRHIYLRKAFGTGEIMLCLVCTKTQDFRSLAEAAMRRFPEIKSVILNINPDNTNVILGKKSVTVAGKDTITDIMCGRHFELSPHSFYQVNTAQAERLYALAAEFASNGEKIPLLLDLYCGAGTIGISLSDRAEKVIGVEIVPQAVENARESAKLNSIDNAEFICADAGEAADRLAAEGMKPSVIILDPPRKGCDEKTLLACVKMNPEKIVMISCNPATAARDCAFLSAHGHRCDRLRAVDMFPRTGHVETVVLMSRK